MDKQSLRKLYKDKRQALSQEEIKRFSEAICVHVIELLKINGHQTVHCFLPITKLNEVDTWPIIEHCIIRNSELQVASSVSNFENNTLTHLLLTPNSEYSTNDYGITEPKVGNPVQSKDITIVIIPLLAADCNGNRIGYGKGFYDRFLKDCSPDVQKIGVSFFPPVEFDIKTNEFDIPLNKLVTPEKVYTFNQ